MFKMLNLLGYISFLFILNNFIQVSSTSFGNNITPTYWSASQLLSEHEIRSRDLASGDVINYDPSSTGQYGYGHSADGVYMGGPLLTPGGYPRGDSDQLGYQPDGGYPGAYEATGGGGGGGYYQQDLQSYNDQYYDQYNPR